MEHAWPTFTIIRVYADGALAADTDDDRLRGFSWCWEPRQPEEIVLVAPTATEVRVIRLDEAEAAQMTADGFVRLLAESYRDAAHVDGLIAMWFEHVSNDRKSSTSSSKMSSGAARTAAEHRSSCRAQPAGVLAAHGAPGGRSRATVNRSPGAAPSPGPLRPAPVGGVCGAGSWGQGCSRSASLRSSPRQALTPGP
jgi:hypothetical protein